MHARARRRRFEPAAPNWGPTQVAHARVIVAVGRQMRVPARGWVIAVATAMQESSLRNLPGGDRDSVGLFQQRPSQGWGSRAQLTDPRYASHAFYAHLLRVAGWQQMPLTDAAQTVQHSATPHAYAKWEDDAQALVASITNRPAEAIPGSGCGEWIQPVRAPIVSGFRTSDRPRHNGVDLGAPRGTLIRAASAGVVTTVDCNISVGTCDQDGSPSVKGCGWYVDITHDGGVSTRYCHMAHRPRVALGQRITTGQPLGQVGSSGNSSGPHLHYEVRLHGRAVDPVRFMRGHGAPLGVVDDL